MFMLRRLVPSIRHDARTPSTHPRTHARATSLRVRTTLGPAPLVPTASLLPAACALAPITWSHAASPCDLLPSVILPTHAHAYAPTMGHTDMLMSVRRILLPLLLTCTHAHSHVHGYTPFGQMAPISTTACTREL